MRFARAAIRTCIAWSSWTAVTAFAPCYPGVASKQKQKQTMLHGGASDPNMSNLDLSGNTWKPTEGRMHSTDTSDYAPTNQEDIDMINELEFTDGIYGSQVANDNANRDKMPQLPGMEHLGEDALMHGGIEVHEDIPDDMEFVPGSVPDGNIEFQLPLSSTGQHYLLEIKPFCMGFEDYYAAFTQDSNPVFRIVDGAVGRMDRRGGEPTYLDIVCENRGHSGEFLGTIVVNIPDDGSKLTYTVKATTIG